jgi:hypothetical protein
MTDDLSHGIWAPHEAFYLESMFYCTNTALRAADEVHDALANGAQLAPSSPAWQECGLIIVNGVQTLAVQAAALSRYFWPARAKEPHLSRAARLRAGLGISDDSRLRNRDLRNHLEHFDERLDDFCRHLRAAVILPTYVGPIGPETDVPQRFFRAYFTDVGVLEILGHRFELQPILEDLQLLHDRLAKCLDSGGRISASNGG